MEGRIPSGFDGQVTGIRRGEEKVIEKMQEIRRTAESIEVVIGKLENL